MLTKRIFRYVSCRLFIIMALSIGLQFTTVGEQGAAYAASRAKTTKKASSKSKSRSGTKSKTKTRHTPRIQTLYSGEDGSWIHRGNRGIVIHRDTAGVVRAMSPFTSGAHAGRKYAEAINEYSRLLKPDGVKVYMLIAPAQAEYYMPEGMASARGAEQRAIKATASYLDPDVVPVFVNDTFLAHRDEEIYNRTDHHWSPLGGYYAAGELAKAAKVKFRPLDSYQADTIHNYVGTMYRFSGDPEVKKAPEEFVYYIPPKGYKAEFIDYKLSGGASGHTIGESDKHEASFFRRFPDGSGAAYCTFMGGDSHTVAVSETGGTPGRRLLIVKDSYGNAVASNLFGSFEEVHVVDFRYFPHNLPDYIRENHITDLVFINCTSLAFAPKTTERLRTMLTGDEMPGEEEADEEETETSETE